MEAVSGRNAEFVDLAWIAVTGSDCLLVPVEHANLPPAHAAGYIPQAEVRGCAFTLLQLPLP
jgi:hypothetical protein